MSEKYMDTENGTIRYKIEKEKVLIIGFQGFAPSLELPYRIEGYPVSAIDRKAFLSCKSLCSLFLPHSLEEVGDWAFAHCDSLREVSFPGQEVRFGRAVFKDCNSLERIVIREKTCESREQPAAGDPKGAGCGEMASCAELLAAAVTMLDAPYLLNLRTAGSVAWLEQWDLRLLSILRTSDSEGYISQSVYGEEDYIGTDLEEFTSQKRKLKVRLCFLRLLHPQSLNPSLKNELEQYLRSLTKGQPTEETWQIIRGEHGSHRDYYGLFAQLGCITRDNFDGILGEIGEESPEMKAFFLKYMEKQRGEERDFFDSLEF